MIDSLLQRDRISGRAAHDASGRHRPQMPGSLARRLRRVPRIIATARAEARGRQIMATQTTPERIRPVPGPHVVRVQHEGLVTAAAERSKDFYCRVLGFQVLPRPAFSTGGYWLGTPGIFPQIHLIQSDLVPPGPDAVISPALDIPASRWPTTAR
jgi:hypothetical protein